MDYLQTIFKTNRPVATEPKGMQKTPEFDAKYDPVVTESKGMQKKLQNLTHHMTL